MNLPGANFAYNCPKTGYVTVVLGDGSSGTGRSMGAAIVAALKQKERNQKFAVPVVILVSGKGPDAVRNAKKRAKLFEIILKILLYFFDIEVKKIN